LPEKSDRFICLRFGRKQLLAQLGVTGRPFCAFLHGLGHKRSLDALVKIVNNQLALSCTDPVSKATVPG
jgi:hypothetical protein